MQVFCYEQREFINTLYYGTLSLMIVWCFSLIRHQPILVSRKAQFYSCGGRQVCQVQLKFVAPLHCLAYLWSQTSLKILETNKHQNLRWYRLLYVTFWSCLSHQKQNVLPSFIYGNMTYHVTVRKGILWFHRNHIIWLVRYLQNTMLYWKEVLHCCR